MTLTDAARPETLSTYMSAAWSGDGRYDGLDTVIAAIAEGAAKLKALTPLIDARLGAGPFLNGEHLSFADIMLGHTLYRYYTLAFERALTPNLDAYYARLRQRPAYVAHAMVSYDSLRVT